MSLIIATGSNLGDREKNLKQALLKLKNEFEFIAASRIYESKAQDFSEQDDFLNQVLEFKTPSQNPQETMQKLLQLELEMGRVREKKYGPRVIDLDILFWDLITMSSDILVLPHPKWQERSFVVHPLSELPYAQVLKKHFAFPSKFPLEARVYQK